MRTRLTPVLLAALVLVAAGCQGDDDPSFAAEADAVCEAQYADFANTLAVTGVVSNLEEDIAAREERDEARRAATAKLGGLSPPPPDAADFRAYLDERRSQEQTEAAAIQALRTGDRAAFEEADLALLAHDRELRRLEAKLGLDVCAQDLADAAADAVEEVLVEAFTEEDAGCPDNYTERFLRQALSAEEECELLEDDLLPETIAVRAVRGSEGEVASAEVRIEGGPHDDSVFGVRLLYDRTRPVIADMLRISRPPPPAGS